MSKVLFVPLNQNHVLIFKNIIQQISSDYILLCHDRISEAEQYYTEALAKEHGLSYRHFPDPVNASSIDRVDTRCVNFFKIRKQVRYLLDDIRPYIIVLALDNDPISQIIISEAKKRKINTLMVSEGLLKPYDLLNRKIHLSDYFYGILRKLGVYIKYIRYGSGGCDYVLVSGKRSYDILKLAGLCEERMTIVGQQKYDKFLSQLQFTEPQNRDRKVLLYAASMRIFHEDDEINLVRAIVKSANVLMLSLIVKLHPRTPKTPEDFLARIGTKDSNGLKVIKEGYETFDMLKQIDIVITIASAIVLEALMMDKECIAASYLAGRRRFDYDSYDAIYAIEEENEVMDIIWKAATIKKKYINKKRLLEDEIYKLDGKAGERTAKIIEKLISS